MKVEDRRALLKQVENIAALAGLNGEIDSEGWNFAMSFQTREGRSQTVYVRPSGMTPDNRNIVRLFSPARKVVKGVFSGISRDQALELLRLNENTFFARFGIWESETSKESLIVASADMILETLDPEELKAHAYYVAFAADHYESKHGSDSY